MKVIIVGCGRVGAALAISICQQHHVTLVDTNPRSFERLGPDFIGRTVEGEGFDRPALIRAGIETADALAAVTSSDSVNVIAARLARDIYHLEHVVARVYNPRRTSIYDKFGLQTVSSSSWGAKRIEQLLLHPGIQSICSAGNGEVQIYEITVPDEWSGRKISELVSLEYAIPVALARAGGAFLPDHEAVLQSHDILQVSATSEGAAALRFQLHENGKE